MSIKYSEIFSTDEVLSAGSDDVIVLAIVDGGAPTGYTTKAIKVSNLVTGGGDVATDVIWDANLDLAVGTGSDTAARLAGGAALQVLRVNAGATALEWVNPSGGDNGLFGGANEGGSLAVLNFDLGGATTQTGSAVNTFTHTGGDYIIEGAVELELFKIDFSLDTVNITGGFNIEGLTVLNEDDTIDTLTIGNDSVGNLRAGILFNSNHVTPSRIYDRSDGTHNKGLTLQSRDDIFEFINSAGVINTANIHIGEISHLRFLRGTTNAPFRIQGASTPNDAGDGVSIETADNSNVMTERFKIEGDSLLPKAYLQNVGGFVIGHTNLDSVSMLEVRSTTKGFRITPMTAAQALAITPVEGLQVFVSNTSGVFATIGLHSYENGAWVKM